MTRAWRDLSAPDEQGELASDDALLPRSEQANQRGPVERLPLIDGESDSRNEPLLGEIAEPARVLGPDLPDLVAAAERGVGECRELGGFDLAGRRGNRVAVRIVLRVPENARHPLDQ